MGTYYSSEYKSDYSKIQDNIDNDDLKETLIKENADKETQTIKEEDILNEEEKEMNIVIVNNEDKKEKEQKEDIFNDPHSNLKDWVIREYIRDQMNKEKEE